MYAPLCGEELEVQSYVTCPTGRLYPPNRPGKGCEYPPYGPGRTGGTRVYGPLFGEELKVQ